MCMCIVTARLSSISVAAAHPWFHPRLAAPQGGGILRKCLSRLGMPIHSRTPQAAGTWVVIPAARNSCPERALVIGPAVGRPLHQKLAVVGCQSHLQAGVAAVQVPARRSSHQARLVALGRGGSRPTVETGPAVEVPTVVGGIARTRLPKVRLLLFVVILSYV